jgi:signal transduction histidine kinase
MRHGHPPVSGARLGLVLLAALVVVAAASVPLARSLVRPVLALQDATRRLGAGDLGARVGLDRADEIGDLARSFDDMAGRIAGFVGAEKELLANVSHELRTPLSRIRVVLELASDGDPARAQRYLGEIGQDLEELDRLVEDVLTAAKLDLQGSRAGGARVPMRLDRVSFGDLVERARARFAGLHAGRALEIDAAAGLPALRCDPVMMRRVLDNLLDNAAKYAPAPATVRVEARAEGAELCFVVKDDGPGMPPEVAARAFEPFFRGDTSRDRRTGGVGLGLSLVRRIIEAHGGTVELASAPGAGTAVTVRVPIEGPATR